MICQYLSGNMERIPFKFTRLENVLKIVQIFLKNYLFLIISRNILFRNINKPNDSESKELDLFLRIRFCFHNKKRESYSNNQEDSLYHFYSTDTGVYPASSTAFFRMSSFTSVSISILADPFSKSTSAFVTPAISSKAFFT